MVRAQRCDASCFASDQAKVLDGFAALFMKTYRKLLMRHCEERCDEAIQSIAARPWIASPGSSPGSQ